MTPRNPLRRHLLAAAALLGLAATGTAHAQAAWPTQPVKILGLGVHDAKCWMIRTARWKYVAFKAFDRAQLFDLETDPREFVDLGQSPAHAAIRGELHAMLFARLADRRNRVTVRDEDVEARTDGARANGVIIGEW